MADTLSILLSVVLCGLLTLLVLHYSLHWRSSVHSGAPLPKGTYSWPIIGETSAILRDPLGFAISHEKRYGNIFKSSVFLQKTIFGTTPEFMKFVCGNPDLFKVQYPGNIAFVAPDAIFFGDGPRHLAIKKLFKRFTFPDSLATMVPALESIILKIYLLGKRMGPLLAEMRLKCLLQTRARTLPLELRASAAHQKLGKLAVKNLLNMIASIGAIPINLPGTAYHKGHQARNALRSYMKSIVENRMGKEDTEFDILRIMLEARDQATGEEVKYFAKDKMMDEMVGAWFVAFKTTATTLVWTLKFLVDYPDVFSRIQAEQQEIREGHLSVEGPRLTWEDTRKMVYTGKVYQEVQRSLSIAFVIARKAAKDVVYDGFLISKGWGVLPMITYVHHDPANYQDPMTFNPDRFDATPKPNTYLPLIHR